MDLLLDALERHRREGQQWRLPGQQLRGAGAGDDLAGLGHPALQAGRQVHGGAHDGVVHALFAADVAGEGLAAVDADPHAQFRVAFGSARVEPRQGLLHAHGGVHRVPGVLRVGRRRPEERHDGVADVLVQGPPAQEDLLGHGLEGAVEDGGQLQGLHALGHAGEAGEVGEQHRDLAAAGLQQGRVQVLGGAEDLAHHLGTVVALQALAEPGLPLALDAHRGEGGHGRQQVLVLPLEAALAEAGFQVDHAQGLVVHDQGRAQGGGDPVDLDAFPRGKAGVHPGVGGQDGHLLGHGLAGDGPADGGAVAAGPFLPDDFRDQLAARVGQQDEAALAADLRGHQGHDRIQQLRQPGGAQQLAGHGGQALEQGVHFGGRSLGLVLGEQGLEAGMGDHDAGGRVEGSVFQLDPGLGAFGGSPGQQRRRGELRLPQPVHGHFTQQGHLARLHGGGFQHRLIVQGGAVQGMQIGDAGQAVAQEDPGVHPAHGVGIDAQVRGLAATDGHARFGEVQGMPRPIHDQGDLHRHSRKCLILTQTCSPGWGPAGCGTTRPVQGILEHPRSRGRESG